MAAAVMPVNMADFNDRSLFNHMNFAAGRMVLMDDHIRSGSLDHRHVLWRSPFDHMHLSNRSLLGICE